MIISSENVAVPPGNGKYTFPVFFRIVLSRCGDLLGREVVLCEFAPDPLLLGEDGEVLAGLRRGLDVPGVAQS
jgi:hypothetical protein